MGSDNDPGQDRALAIVEAVLGVPVEKTDDGAVERAVDLGWTVDDVRIACEVKQVTSPNWMSARDKTGRFDKSEDLRYTWQVILPDGRLPRSALRELHELFVDAERQGVRQMSVRDESLLGARLKELGGEHAYGDTSRSFGPGVLLVAAGHFYFVPPIHDLPKWVSRLVDSDQHPFKKLRRQLAGASEADERHAFLVLDSHEPMSGLLSSQQVELPDEPPTLPTPIDAIWVASWRVDTTVIRWSSGRGWERPAFDLGAIPLPTQREL